MNLTEEEQYKKVKAYLKGQLPSDEKVVFENKMDSDPELLQSVKFYNLLIQGLETQAVKKEVDDYFIYRRRKDEIRGNILKTVAGVAIILALLILVQYWKFSDNVIAMSSFEKYPPFETNIQRGINEDENFDPEYITILQNQELDQVSEVIEYFSSIPASNSLYTKALFNLAYAFTLDKEYVKAVQTFETIQQIDESEINSEILEETEYYLALSYLMNGQVDDARRLLSKISRSKSHKYYVRAKNVIEKLDSFWRFGRKS